MHDKFFWGLLARYAGSWFQNSEQKALRWFWIDDFIPMNIRDTKLGVDVEGTAWVCNGPKQYPYHFTVSIPQKMLHRRREHFAIDQLVLDLERHTVQVTVVYEKP